MSTLEASVRDLIARYVASSITAEELSESLPDGWDLDEAAEPVATDLVLRAIGYLAEYQRSDRSESELKEALTGEASWHLERSASPAANLIIQSQPLVSVRADADTPLREVLAS